MNVINNRKLWIDALRGIAIILVIYGHLRYKNIDFYVWTSPFKMPLFFVIIGYVFNEVRCLEQPLIDFLKKIFRQLMVPWVLLSLLPIRIIYRFVFKSYSDAYQLLYDFASGNECWFIPCVLIAEFIYFFICKNISKFRLKVICSFSITKLGLLLAKSGVGNFAMFNTACVAQFFIFIGYSFKKYEYILKSKVLYQYCFFLSYMLLIYISSYYYPSEVIDVHLNSYYNYILCFLLIAVSCYGLMTIGNKIKYPRILVYIGQNTIVFYLLSGLCTGLAVQEYIIGRRNLVIVEVSAICFLYFIDLD